MNDLRTAAQQALEALELAKLNGKAGLYPAEVEEITDAITALRAALAEPVQEPVAKCVDDICSEHLGRVEAFDHLPRGTLLYAILPQRKPLKKEQLLYIYNQLPNWGMDMDSLPQGLEKFARAVEAAHKIGGEE